jgi:hypothetical protein
MHKDVTTSDLTKKQTVGCLIQELDILPRGGLGSDEQETKS